MEDLVISNSVSMFKIFGLGFLAGGIFSFAVSLISDWMSDRENKRHARAEKHHVIK